MKYQNIIVSQYQNVFQKNPVPGLDLFNQLLRNEISCRQAAKVFNDNNIKVSERNIQVIMKRIRDGNSKPKPKPASSIIPTDHQPPQKDFKSYLADIRKEFDAIDYDDVKKIDPVIILYKNLMKLEILMSKMQFENDIKGLGDIIELERKISLEIHKIAPNTEEIDYNDLFRKNDLCLEFIMILDQEKPNLGIKQSWLEFIKEKENI